MEKGLQVRQQTGLTSKEQAIVLAKKSKKISEASDMELKQMAIYIMALVGIDVEAVTDPAQSAVLLEFLRNKMGLVSIDQVKIAFDMAAAEEVDVDLTHYNKLNGAYIARIYKASDRLQNAAIKKGIQDDYDNIYGLKDATDEHKDKMKSDFMENCLYIPYDKYVETDTYNFGKSESVMYDTLEKGGFISLTKEEKESIYKFAKNELRTSISPTTREDRSLLKKLMEDDFSDVGELMKAMSKRIAFKQWILKCKENNVNLRELCAK